MFSFPKKNFLLATGLVLLLVVPAQSQTITRELDLRDFDKIEAGNALTIVVRQGEAFRITASGEAEGVNDLRGEVKNGELSLYFKEQQNRLRTSKGVRVEITLPALKSARFGGTSQSRIERGFTPDNLVVYLTGVAEAEIDLDARKLFLDLSGTSVATLRGQGQSLSANVTGAARLYAQDYPVKDATLDVSGACVAKVNVAQSLKATAVGTSKVRYRGNPTKNSFDARGISSIKQGD